MTRMLNLLSLSVMIQCRCGGLAMASHWAFCFSGPCGGNAPFVKWPSVIVTGWDECRGSRGRWVRPPREQRDTTISVWSRRGKQDEALASTARSPLQTSHTNHQNTHSQTNAQLGDIRSKLNANNITTFICKTSTFKISHENIVLITCSPKNRGLTLSDPWRTLHQHLLKDSNSHFDTCPLLKWCHLSHHFDLMAHEKESYKFMNLDVIVH